MAIIEMVTPVTPVPFSRVYAYARAYTYEIGVGVTAVTNPIY